jgi:hypothetical protein
MTAAFGIDGVVQKRRLLFRIGQTRPVDRGSARDLRDHAGSSDADAQLTGVFAPAHSPDARANAPSDFLI